MNRNDNQNDMANDTRESVAGIVDSIIYQSEDTGYTVCELEDANGEPVTVVGVIPYLTEGDKITAYGNTSAYKRHTVYKGVVNIGTVTGVNNGTTHVYR